MASESFENPFDGQDYDGEADVEMAYEDDTKEQFGDRAIVASIHIVDGDDDDEYNIMAGIHIVDDDDDDNENDVMASIHIVDVDDDDDEYDVMASIHIVDDDDDDDEDEVVYMAAMATSGKEREADDSQIAEELLTTVKGQYEEWGSGIKPKPHGPSAN